MEWHGHNNPNCSDVLSFSFIIASGQGRIKAPEACLFRVRLRRLSPFGNNAWRSWMISAYRMLSTVACCVRFRRTGNQELNSRTGIKNFRNG